MTWQELRDLPESIPFRSISRPFESCFSSIFIYFHLFSRLQAAEAPRSTSRGRPAPQRQAECQRDRPLWLEIPRNPSKINGRPLKYLKNIVKLMVFRLFTSTSSPCRHQAATRMGAAEAMPSTTTCTSFRHWCQKSTRITRIILKAFVKTFKSSKAPSLSSNLRRLRPSEILL